MALTYAHPDSDRRQGLRVRQTRPVKIFHPVANRYLPALTCDLSPTGLRLSLSPSTPLTPGTRLDVLVASPSASPLASKRSMTPARVVWIDRSAPDKLHVGLQYLSTAAAAARVA